MSAQGVTTHGEGDLDGTSATQSVTDGSCVVPALSVKANSVWFLVGNATYTLAQWCMVVLVAHLGSAYSVGVFALAFAVSAPVIMLANLRLRFVQASDAKDEHEFLEYFALRLVTTALALGVIAIVAMCSQNNIISLTTILLIGIAKSFEAISDIYYGLLQKHQRMDVIARSLMLKSFLSLALFGGGLYISRNILVACAGLAIAWGLVLIGMDARAPMRLSAAAAQRRAPRWHILRGAMRYFQSRIASRSIRRLAFTALPLGAVAFLVSLSANIPRYVIEWRFGSEKLGYYAAISYFMVAAVTMMASVGQAAMPRLAQLFAGMEFHAFKHMLLRLVFIAVGGGIAGIGVAWLFGDSVLSMFYGQDYVQYRNVFVVMMVATALNCVAMCLWYAMTAMREFKVQLPLFAGDVVIVAVVSVVLVPRMGIIGGAVALACVMTYHIVVGAAVVRFKLAAAVERGGYTGAKSSRNSAPAEPNGFSNFDRKR